MKLRLSALTPFLLGALVRGQITQDAPGTGLSAKDLAAVPKPGAAPLPVVPCVGALKEDYDLFLADYPEKEYEEEEYAERCSHFHYSRAYVAAMEAKEASLSFEVSLNQFADLSPKELANLGGALPVATNAKPALFTPTIKTLGATTATTTATPITTENAQLEADPINAGAGDATPAGRKRHARKERRMERRRAARRRDLAEGEGEEEEPAVVMAAQQEPEAAAESAAALWNLSAFEGEAAEALVEEAPALGIKALREAPAEPAPSSEFETMGLRDPSPAAGAAPAAVEVDRHGVNGPGTIAAVTRLAAPLPATLDYSTEDNPYMVEAMGDVQDTGKCGASWALAAAGLAESRVALDSGVAPDNLSAKELVDCVDPAFGCEGGRIERALTYASNNGLGSEADNAWATGVAEAAGVCKIDPEGERAYLGVISQVSPCNQRDLMRALVYLGPVAAHVKSSCRSFLFYSGGILEDEDCFAMAGARPSACAAAVDHNVLIVGYDSDAETSVDYWILKGNFGEEWGEGGYARVKMATRGLCGTGCLAAFPLTVVPRTFGIDAQGKPVYDGSAPSFISAYNAEAAAAANGSDAVAPVDPTTILPAPLPNQRTNAGAGTGPTTTTTPGAGNAAPAPVTAPEGAKASASAAEEEAARKRRNRIVGGAVGGVFAGVFALVAAFVAVKTLQQRRAEMSEVPERPHLDVL